MKSKLFFIILLCSCTFGKKNKLQNTAFLYQEKITKIRPEYLLYHQTPDSTTLYCKIKTNQLLSVFSASEKLSKIHFSINGKIFLAENEDIAIDSFSLQKNIADTSNTILGQFNFLSNLHEAFILKVQFIDENKGLHTTEILYFEKEYACKENFRVLEEGKLQFRTQYNVGDTIDVKHNLSKETLWVNYYNTEFPAAKTPYDIGEVQAQKIDAKNSSTIVTDTTFYSISLNKKGIYQLTQKQAEKKGLSLFVFEDDYPKVSSIKEMIPPLQYLCNTEEFQTLILAKDTKNAVDEFWLSSSKNNSEQSRKLIRIFYKRVEDANTFFTSYKEGWKTDRGMIMILFGSPNIIYKTKEGESWIYGERNNMYALNFTFTKIKNKFTNNDFELNRSVYFKNIWNTAKSTWRNGYAYSDMDIKEKIYEQERRQRQSQFYFWN